MGFFGMIASLLPVFFIALEFPAVKVFAYNPDCTQVVLHPYCTLLRMAKIKK